MVERVYSYEFSSCYDKRCYFQETLITKLIQTLQALIGFHCCRFLYHGSITITHLQHTLFHVSLLASASNTGKNSVQEKNMHSIVGCTCCSEETNISLVYGRGNPTYNSEFTSSSRFIPIEHVSVFLTFVRNKLLNVSQIY